MSLAVPKSPPAPPPRKARGSPASVAEPDSPRAHASPSSASAREELVSALKDQRLRISSLTETLLEAQRAVDALKLEHVAEGVDGRLLAERMLSRLAAAQAMQAAAAARQGTAGTAGGTPGERQPAPPDHMTTATPFLPPLLTMENGTSVSSAAAWWAARRPEVSSLLQRHLVGTLPATRPALLSY